jgi:hypothetical protein
MFSSLASEENMVWIGRGSPAAVNPHMSVLLNLALFVTVPDLVVPAMVIEFAGRPPIYLSDPSMENWSCHPRHHRQSRMRCKKIQSDHTSHQGWCRLSTFDDAVQLGHLLTVPGKSHSLA